MDTLEGSEANLNAWSNYPQNRTFSQALSERPSSADITFEIYDFIEAGLGHLVELFAAPTVQTRGLFSRLLRNWRSLIDTLICSRGPGNITYATSRRSSILPNPSGNLISVPGQPDILHYVTRFLRRLAYQILSPGAKTPEATGLRDTKVDVYPQFYRNHARRAEAYRDLLVEAGDTEPCTDMRKADLQPPAKQGSMDSRPSYLQTTCNGKPQPQSVSRYMQTSTLSPSEWSYPEEVFTESSNDDRAIESAARSLLTNLLLAEGWQFRPSHAARSLLLSAKESQSQNTITASRAEVQEKANMMLEMSKKLNSGVSRSLHGDRMPPRPNTHNISQSLPSHYRPDALLRIKEKRRLVACWLQDAQ